MAGRKAYLVRLPEELLEELNRWAKDELRSLNGQVEWILREAVRKRRGKSIGPEPPEDAKPA